MLGSSARLLAFLVVGGKCDSSFVPESSQCDGTALCPGFADGDCACTPGGGGSWYMWTCNKRSGATIPTTWCSAPGCECNTIQERGSQLLPALTALQVSQCNAQPLCSGYADGDCACTPGGDGSWYMWSCSKRQGAIIDATWCSIPGCECNTVGTEVSEMLPVERVTAPTAHQCNGQSLCSGFADGDCECTLGAGGGWYMWSCTKRQGTLINPTYCSVPGCECNTVGMEVPERLPAVRVTAPFAHQCNGQSLCSGFADGDCECTPGAGGAWYMWSCTKRQGALINPTYCSVPGCECNTVGTEVPERLPAVRVNAPTAHQCNGQSLCSGFADGDCGCTPGAGGAWYMWSCTKRQGALINPTYCSVPGCECNTVPMFVSEVLPALAVIAPEVNTCNGTALCSSFADGDCACTPGADASWYMWTCTKRRGATIPTTWCSIPDCKCNAHQELIV